MGQLVRVSSPGMFRAVQERLLTFFKKTLKAFAFGLGLCIGSYLSKYIWVSSIYTHVPREINRFEFQT